ncbi:MAG TPA: hypothetical protein ENJ08_10020 [Gammaproteobacteria bacterium]|nr:hypothetical protein [Gammaproteobacteria bacterium]
MSITMHIPSRLQAVTGNQPFIYVPFADNLLEALQLLASHCPDIKNSLFDMDNQINPYIRLSVNDVIVSDLTTPLSDNSDVFIFAAIAGG